LHHPYKILIQLRQNFTVSVCFGTVAVGKSQHPEKLVTFLLLGVGNVHKFSARTLQKIHQVWSKEGKPQTQSVSLFLSAYKMLFLLYNCKVLPAHATKVYGEVDV
jgi:hypothetical protein